MIARSNLFEKRVVVFPPTPMSEIISLWCNVNVSIDCMDNSRNYLFLKDAS